MLGVTAPARRRCSAPAWTPWAGGVPSSARGSPSSPQPYGTLDPRPSSWWWSCGRSRRRGRRAVVRGRGRRAQGRVGRRRGGWAGWTGRCLRRGADGVGRDVVEDVAHQRRGGLGAVATLVDHREHEVLGVRVGPEGRRTSCWALPAGVRRGARLARQVPRGREALEVGVGRAGPVRDHALEALEHRRVVGRGDGHVPRHLRGDLLDHLAGHGVDDLRRHLGGVARPAVGEGRVGDRLLNRGQHGLALPECHLDVVAGEPRRRVGERLGRLGVQLGPQEVAVDAPLRLPGKVDAGDRPLAVLRRLVLNRRVTELSPVGPEHLPQVVEERVARHGQRAATRRSSRRCRPGRRAGCSRCRC